MLRMERNLKKYQKALKINNPENKMTFVDLVLHMHDELIYEVTTTTILKNLLYFNGNN